MARDESVALDLASSGCANSNYAIEIRCVTDIDVHVCVFVCVCSCVCVCARARVWRWTLRPWAARTQITPSVSGV